MAVMDMKWVAKRPDDASVEAEIGTEYYRAIRTYVKNIKNYQTQRMDGKYICRSEKITDKLIFIIAGLTSKYEYGGFCGGYYCEDEKMEEEIKFARKIYNLLTI